MTTLSSVRVAGLLDRLHEEAEVSDREHREEMMTQIDAAGGAIDAVITDMLAEERADYRATYRRYAGNFLAISPAYGRLLYAAARACKARRIVEFGTSMGVSTLYLAAALRDNGGGQLIGSELEPAKAARARANLEAAELADLVDIREGDALDTLRDVGGEVDLLLIDGAFSLYLPVLKLIEPRLRYGAMIFGENAFDPAYKEYVGDPANGYLSFALPDESRGNMFAVKVA